MNNPTISIVNSKTGDIQKIGEALGPVTIGFKNEHTPPIDITTSSQFNCSLNAELYNEKLAKICKQTQQWKQAVRLSEELNDLIEEYHAPGTPRRERRAINRQFNKVFMIFSKHCRLSQIDYTFTRAPR